MLKKFLGKGAADQAPEATPAEIPVPELIEVLQGLLSHADAQSQSSARLEQAVAEQTPMIQFLAKGIDRSDRNREQLHLDLRKHLTSEVDRLSDSLTEQAARAAAIQMFEELLPALDDLERVGRGLDEARGGKAVAMVLRKLLRVLEKWGIEQIRVATGETRFDAELHDGRPYDGDPAAIEDVAEGVIVEELAKGYRCGERVLRPATVSVAGHE